MSDLLENYDYLIIPYLSQIGRAILIPFVTLGVVYTLGKMLEILNTDRSKNSLAFICIVFLSFLTGSFNNELKNMITFDYIFNSFIYSMIGVIIYINVCWKLYTRIDNLLDKKIASDEKEESERKKVKAAEMRQVKKENKKLEEENKKLERVKKRLTKKE